MTTFKKRVDAKTSYTLRSTGKLKLRSLLLASLSVAILAIALTGCSFFHQEERVFDTFYDAVDIVAREFDADSYEMLHNSDLPFYTGDDTDHVVVYVNSEDGSKPFDRLWIIVSPETESEAIAVLDDFEAYLDLGNGAHWIRDGEALRGTTEITETFGPGISHHPNAFWNRDIPDAETWENAVVEEKGYMKWYARRYKTMVLVMNIAYSRYERDGEYWRSEPDEMNEWKKRVRKFEEYFENAVDTDGFWE